MWFGPPLPTPIPSSPPTLPCPLIIPPRHDVAAPCGIPYPTPIQILPANHPCLPARNHANANGVPRPRPPLHVPCPSISVSTEWKCMCFLQKQQTCYYSHAPCMGQQLPACWDRPNPALLNNKRAGRSEHGSPGQRHARNIPRHMSGHAYLDTSPRAMQVMEPAGCCFVRG